MPFKEEEYLNELASRCLALCEQREWSLHWTDRAAHLHLEVSELFEAVRGKRGDALEEAADVLFVLMTTTQNQNLSFFKVTEYLHKKISRLEVEPHYRGEEYGTKKR